MATLNQISRLRKQIEALEKAANKSSVSRMSESEKQHLRDRCDKLLAESRRIRAEQEVNNCQTDKSLPEPTTTVDTAPPEVTESLDEFEAWLGEDDED